MKAVLFLFLLTFMVCEKDIIDIGKCIYKAPLVKELISDVIAAIATKDYSKLLPKIKEVLPELIKIVLGCLVDTNTVEDQAKLEGINCDIVCGTLPVIARQNCYNMCKNQM